ncbi:hypothetical protein T08_14646 [Trichinella sp. T8]|nr:hypothetical protein T08_14646 [Trichinella sp. T8]
MATYYSSNRFGTKLRCVHRREEVSSITQLLYLRSCLSSPALKAIEGVTDVVESLVVLNSCADDGAAELTRLHDELNGHILELKALGKNANSGLSVFHPLLLIIKKKLRSGTVTDCKGFVTDKMDDEITLDEFLAYLFDQTRIRESDNATRTKATLKKDKPEYEKREKYELRFRTAAVLPLSEVPDAMDLLGKDATGSLAALFEYFRGEWMTPNKLPLWNLLHLLIEEQGAMKTLIQQVTSGCVTKAATFISANKFCGGGRSWIAVIAD